MNSKVNCCSMRRTDNVMLLCQVMSQWVEALVKGGIHPSRIEIIGNQSLLDGQPRSKTSEVRLGLFILCTRYRIQNTMKGKFEYDTLATLQQSLDRCALFKNVEPELIRVMQNQYLAKKGALKTRKEADKHKVPGLKEKPCDRITRLLREHVNNLKNFSSMFETGKFVCYQSTFIFLRLADMRTFFHQ